MVGEAQSGSHMIPSFPGISYLALISAEFRCCLLHRVLLALSQHHSLLIILLLLLFTVLHPVLISGICEGIFLFLSFPRTGSEVYSGNRSSVNAHRVEYRTTNGNAFDLCGHHMARVLGQEAEDV